MSVFLGTVLPTVIERGSGARVEMFGLLLTELLCRQILRQEPKTKRYEMATDLACLRRTGLPAERKRFASVRMHRLILAHLEIKYTC